MSNILFHPCATIGVRDDYMPKNIRQSVPLRDYTTLGVGGLAEYFVDVTSQAELIEVVSWAQEQGHAIILLGGGSNVLVSDVGVRGLIVRMGIEGITYETHERGICVTAGAGVFLDALVEELVSKDLWGLENFTSIPGTVGAVPIQNVGAYGVEAKDVVESVTVYNITQKTIQTLSNSECAFGYRDSLFKQPAGRHYIIMSVTFMLTTTPNPKLAYKDLKALCEETEVPHIRDVRDTIASIRAHKFPDWHRVGTAGSFFKNPCITEEQYATLLQKYPELPGYRMDTGTVKIALGWILDHVCNLKGFSENGIGLYEHQALVLVCDRGVSAKSIEVFSQRIIDQVFKTTGISVEREVTMIP